MGELLKVTRDGEEMMVEVIPRKKPDPFVVDPFIEEMKVVKNVVNTFNEEILAPLMKKYNRRQKSGRKITSLGLVMTIPEDGYSSLYLVASENKVLFTTGFGLRDTESQKIKQAIRDVLIDVMREGITRKLKRASDLPEHLI